MIRRNFLTAVMIVWLSAIGVCAETATVRGHVEPEHPTEAKKAGAKGEKKAIPDTVVWLTPAPGSDVQIDSPKPAVPNPKLVQKNKTFEPRVLVVPAGSMVEFPNRDPFFHNVFSLFEGKRFDLGLYEAGSSRAVRFEGPGISYIFCNIHPEMNAVIITVATPFYAIAEHDGEISITNVPFGRYTMHIWSEGMGPDNGKPMVKDITVGESSTSFGTIRVPTANGQHMAHKNKYGRDYDQPKPDSSVYEQNR